MVESYDRIHGRLTGIQRIKLFLPPTPVIPKWKAFIRVLNSIPNDQKVEMVMAKMTEHKFINTEHSASIVVDMLELTNRYVTTYPDDSEVVALQRVPDYLKVVENGALLHDVGKLNVPINVLKKGELTNEERMIIQKHPQNAVDIFGKVKYLQTLLVIALSHQEKWDGTGYPNKLKEKEIPLLGRLFAIIDVWDALTTVRAYRVDKPAWTPEDAIAHIKDQSGKYFDPTIVTLFVKMYEEKQLLIQKSLEDDKTGN